jgi:hypothetical protein
MDAVPSPKSSEHPSTIWRRKANTDKRGTSFYANIILSEDMPHLIKLYTCPLLLYSAS